MAIIKKGILGGFKGKAGTIVGYELNGQDVIRGLGKGRTKPFTKGELGNQKKFKITQLWLQPLLVFLRVGFQDYQPTYQGFVAAKSYNSKNAIVGTPSTYKVDPSLARVSYGNMDMVTSANAICDDQRNIVFTWEGGNYEYDDRAMFLAYDIKNQYAVYETAGVRRSAKTGILKLPSKFQDADVHVYLAFVSEDRKTRSNSKYLGVFKVP